MDDNWTKNINKKYRTSLLKISKKRKNSTYFFLIKIGVNEYAKNENWWVCGLFNQWGKSRSKTLNSLFLRLPFCLTIDGNLDRKQWNSQWSLSLQWQVARELLFLLRIEIGTGLCMYESFWILAGPLAEVSPNKEIWKIAKTYGAHVPLCIKKMTKVKFWEEAQLKKQRYS